MPKCPKCGALYGIDDEFCPDCGKRIKDEKVEDSKKKEITLQKPKINGVQKFLGFLLALAGIALALGGCAICFLIVTIPLGIGMIFLGILIVVVGNLLSSGTVKFACPYCRKDLNASPDKEAIDCLRCGDKILLKWRE